MDEQLQKLLEEADRRQYDATQKEELVQWYLNNQRPTQPADTGGYLQTKYKKREKTPGALQQLGSAAWSAITDQLPGGFASARAASESALADSERAFEDDMIMAAEDVPYTLAGEGFNANAYRAKVLAYQKEKLGEQGWQNAKKKFTETHKDRALGFVKEADIQEAEGQEKTKGNTTSWDQVHNVGDVIRYGASAVGEGIGSSIPAAATAGVSAYIQEQGGAYREAVEETAKALSNQYGEDWTAEDVIKLGYDKPAQEYSNNVALFNTALESVGLLSVFGKAVTPFIKTAAKKVGKSALKQGLKTVATGVVGEGVTEFLQESATQYGALKAAGKTDEEIFGSNGESGLFDWNRSVEAGVRGGIGGGGLSTVSAAVEAGSAAQPKTRVGDPKLAKQELKLTEKRQQAEEKIAQKEGERLARQEQIDAISNEAIDEELNEGTEEDVDEFTSSIVDLLNEKERNEEIAKVEKEAVKLEDEKAKIVEKAITTLEKQEAKEIEKQDNKTEQTQAATEPTATTSTEPSGTTTVGTEPVQGQPATVETVVQPTVTPEAKPVRRRGRPAKVKTQEPVVVTPVQQEVAAQETAKVEPEVAPELKVLQDKKAEIVNRNKGIPQYDDRGNLNWSPKDQAEFRDVNKQIKEFTGATKVAARTPEQIQQFEDFKTGGLDDDTASALTDADRVLEMTPDQMGFKDVKRTERVKNTWKNIKELERKDYVQSTKESLPKDIQDTWGPAIDKMVEVIDRTLNTEGNTFRVFEADPSQDKPTAALGMAYADSGNFYIVNNRQQKANTKIHELAHVFEFAIAERQSQQKNTRDVFKEIDAVHKDVVKTLRQEVRTMRKTLGFDKKQFKENFNKLTNAHKLLVLYVTKGDLGRFDLAQIDSLDEQLASAVTTTSPTKTTPVYGLTNGREMLAEAISNPYFTGLLASLETTTAGKKVTLLEKLYRAFESVLNNVSELLKNSPIAQRYNIKLPSYNTFKNSYLNRLLETLEENLTDLSVDDGDVMNEVLDLAQLPEDEPKRKATGKINREISKKIFDRAVKSGAKNTEEFKKFVTEIDKKLGGKLDASIKRGLTRKFNTLQKKLKTLDDRAKIYDEATKSDKWDSIDFRRVVEDIRAIDPNSLSMKEKEKLVDALDAIKSQDNEKLHKAKTFAQTKAAERAVDEVTDPKTGVGFREFSKFMKAVNADNLVNLPTFIGYISKYAQDKSATLMKYFHDPIGEAYKNTSLNVNTVVSGLNAIAIKNKLGRSNFSRIYFYGQLISDNPIKPKTLEQKYQEERFALQTTMKAIQKSHETDISEQEVVEDIRLLDEIFQQLEAGEDILSAGEKEYYADLRDVLDSNLETIKDNSEITWGQKFVTISNYLPKSVKGVIPMPVKGDATDDKAPMTKNVSVNDSDLLEVMNPGADFQPLRTSESGFHYARTGGRGVYYETNIHNIMAKYLQSTLFNVHAGYQVQKLNRMFKGGNAVKLEDELGVRNTNKLLGFLKNSIKYSKRASTDYSNMTKFLLDAKNKLQTAKIGTSGQFVTQLLPMIPATAAMSGYNNTMEAIKFMWKTNTDPNLREDFRSLISNYSSQLAIRDFFFEKYETVEDVAKEGTYGRLRRTAEAVEKNTVTKIMGWSDRTATQLTFLAAFIEAGGKMEDANTWTPERIAKAELKTAQLQNISSPIFAPEALRIDNAKSALVNAALWSFKSFSLNGMMNFILSTPDALMGNTEARKIATAHATSAIGFEIASKAVKGGYAFAAFGIASAFGYEPPERKKDESWLQYIKGVLTNAFYSLFFGGLPSYADNALRYVLNSTAFKWMYGEDSPLYSAKKVEELPGKAIGPFEELYTMPLNTVDYASDYFSGEKITEDKSWEFFGKVFAEALLFAKIVPFRGDAAKLVRSGTSEAKSAKYEQRKKRNKRKRKQEYY